MHLSFKFSFEFQSILLQTEMTWNHWDYKCLMQCFKMKLVNASVALKTLFMYYFMHIICSSAANKDRSVANFSIGLQFVKWIDVVDVKVYARNVFFWQFICKCYYSRISLPCFMMHILSPRMFSVFSRHWMCFMKGR